MDITGNTGGQTWYWGYQNSSQIQSPYIVFHHQTLLDGNTVQLLTDTYSLGGITPPGAPYAGTFHGPGPIIADTPFTRTIVLVPEPSSIALLSLGALALAGRRVLTRHRNRTAGARPDR